MAIVLFSLAARSAQSAAEQQKPLWLVVGKPELVKEIESLAKWRREQGFETVLSTEPIGKAVAAASATTGRGFAVRTPRRPDFLLLIGDDEPGKEDEPWYLPAKRMPLYRWRAAQRKEFASDAAWGDLDGDLVPDIPVGRIPARTPKQVESAVKKILAFERRPATEADLQLVVWGGSPQYGAAIDAMASEWLLGAIEANAPKWIRPWIISGNPHHPLCGWPPDQPKLFTRQIRQGGILGVLMGHASAESFFSMKHAGQAIRYTASTAEAEFAKGPPVPPLVFFSCESGDFAGPAPCMAESFFFFPGGPVATVAATTESHPLTNYFSSLCLLRAIGGPEKRMGTVWLSAQRRARKARNFLIERVLRDVEGKLEEKIDVEKLRRDQVLMYSLLGDPATQLRIPEPLRASVRRTETGWQWKAERPKGATKLLVGYRSAKPRSVEWQEKPPAAKEARAAFEAANAPFAFSPVSSPPDDGPWEGTIEKAGWLRLVATGDRTVREVVMELK